MQRFYFATFHKLVYNFYNIYLSYFGKTSFLSFLIFNFSVHDIDQNSYPFSRVKESVRNIQFMSSSDEFLFTGLKFRLVESLLLSGV